MGTITRKFHQKPLETVGGDVERRLETVGGDVERRLCLTGGGGGGGGGGDLMACVNSKDSYQLANMSITCGQQLVDQKESV